MLQWLRKTLRNPWGAGITCLLVALLLELSLFNYHHYTTLFSDEEVSINLSDCKIDGGKILIHNLDMRISTVWLKPLDSDTRAQTVRFRYTDLDSTRKTPWQIRIPAMEKTSYVVLSPYGKVSFLMIEFDGAVALTADGKPALVEEIVLNSTYPMLFNLLRVLAITGLLFFCWCLRRTKLTTFPYRKNLLQESVRLGTAGVLVLFTAFTAVTSLPGDAHSFAKVPFPDTLQADPYSILLTDALLEGRLDLEVQSSDSIVELPGIKVEDTDEESEGTTNDNLQSDDSDSNDIPYYSNDSYEANLSYYNGKYYSPHGVVPALVLFLPFSAVFGRYMNAAIGVFLFSAAALLVLLLLWRTLVRRFFPSLPFFLSLLGGTALASCSMLVYLNRLPLAYAVPIAGGVFFGAAALWLLLTATEKEEISLWRLALSCLSFALAVGCRPGLIFLSIFVPLLLIPKLKGQKKLPLILTVSIVPYVIVLGLLMWYNYARFGSILEFGSSYLLSTANLGTYKLLNPTQTLDKLLCGILVYLFNTLSIIPWFPYVLPREPVSLSFTGFIPYQTVPGIVSFPVVWGCLGLPFLSKKMKASSPVLRCIAIAAPIIGFIIMGIVVLTDGLAGSALVDFLWLFVLSGLVTLSFLYCRPENSETDRRVLRIIITSIFIVSILLPILLSFTGEGNVFKQYHLRLYYTFRDLLSLG